MIKRVNIDAVNATSMHEVKEGLYLIKEDTQGNITELKRRRNGEVENLMTSGESEGGSEISIPELKDCIFTITIINGKNNSIIDTILLPIKAVSELESNLPTVNISKDTIEQSNTLFLKLEITVNKLCFPLFMLGDGLETLRLQVFLNIKLNLINMMMTALDSSTMATLGIFDTIGQPSYGNILIINFV